MHVRVRWAGREVIVALPSRLSKVEALRRLLSDKLAVPIQNQRLFYGGKLLEDGYTFHDYSIKLNDVIQLMSKIVDNKIQEEKCTKTANGNGHADNSSSDNEQQKKLAEYEDSFSELYKIGDLVDMKDSYIGWVEGKVVTILRKFDHLKKIKKDLDNIENSISSRLNGDVENISPKRRIPKSNENKSPNSPKSLENRTHDDDQKTPSHKSPTTPNTKRGIRHYFSPTTPGHSDDTKSESKTRSKKLKPDESQTEEKKECIENNLANIIEDEEANLLFRIQLSDEDDVTDCKLSQIRPRARKVIEIENLNLNETVMVNYNSEQPHEKGYWYDFTIHEVKKQRKHIELYGSLYQGNIVLNDVKVRHHDKIYCIESIIPVRKRTKELEEIMKKETERRTRPLNCTSCRDKQDAKCKDCGCFICAGKNNPDQIILCDECNMGFHLTCLDPQLTQLPEDDWYCLQCRRDPNEVVAPGQGKQQRKTVQSKSARDWGRGMACVGKTQTCAMPANHFGPIPGIEVGMAWRFRIQLSESGVHRPPVSGIHGRDVDGAYSIVLSGGYEDDVDNGFEFTYTGSGGRDLSGNKRTADQSSDQTLTRENKALAKNCAVKEINEEGGDAKDKWRDGKPVRVVRSYKMLKHFPEYAPKEGIRYDGIYKVVKYYPETGKAGFRVWKYLLRRDDPNPAPWEKNAKQFSIVYPDGYLEAEAEKQALKEKERNKNGQKRKRVLKECNGAIEIETNDKSSKNKKKAKSDSPPPKRMKTRSSISNGNDNQKETVKTKNEKSITPKSTKKNKPVQKSPNSSVNPFTLAATKKEKSSPQNENIKPEEVLSKDNKEAIEKDVLNKKLWSECLTSLSNEGKQGFINNVTKLFLCIICQDLAANPTTTSCGHNFCMVCLKLAFKSTHSKNCPYCRADLSKEEPAHNDLLKVALRAIMPGYDSGKK